MTGTDRAAPSPVPRNNRDAYADVNRACTRWLHERGILGGIAGYIQEEER